MKFYLTFFCLVLYFTNGIGQNAFAIKDFLAGAEQQESVVFQHQKFNFLNTISHDLPIIEKLEFRTETNDFDFRKQEYLLRVSPNSIKNIKAQHQYQQTVQYMTEMELEVSWGKALRERYDLLVNYIHFKEILAVKNKQKILFKDKVTLLKRSISLPDFDVLELIEAEDDQQENFREILDLENAILTFEKLIQRMNKTTRQIQIEKEELAKINELKNILSKVKPTETVSHPQLKVLSAKIYNNMLEYEWESAKSKFSLGYIQAKYGYDPRDNFRESFSIGIGFEIPMKGTARLDLNELQINIFDSESQYKKVINQLVDKKYSLYQQFHNLIKKHELVNQQLDESQAEFALKEYSRIAEASPKAMLKMRENTLKKELLLQKLELEIMQTFIEYLDFSGLLSQKPFRNYLSKDLEGF